MRPLDAYLNQVSRPGYQEDEAQLAAMQALDDLYGLLIGADVTESPGLLARFFDRPRAIPGVYLWGSVGRGKTWLMDMFYACLPRTMRRRSHFHRFMLDVHTRLKALSGHRDPLPKIARELAADTRVICFDELFVSDIADAMLLGGLLTAMFENGMTLVATSNSPPPDLYAGGLQRQRFLPAIAALERHCTVVHLTGSEDYRLRVLEREEMYHCPHNEDAVDALEHFFDQIAPDTGKRGIDLEVNGRPIACLRVADGVLWCHFPALCAAPRSAADYVEIAREFHTVMVSEVPVLDRDSEDDARRFIALVDELYDRNVSLMLSAAVPLDRLYQGRRLTFEFRRTRSRLEEMQSRQFLARAHRP